MADDAVVQETEVIPDPEPEIETDEQMFFEDGQIATRPEIESSYEKGVEEGGPTETDSGGSDDAPAGDTPTGDGEATDEGDANGKTTARSAQGRIDQAIKRQRREERAKQRAEAELSVKAKENEALQAEIDKLKAAGGDEDSSDMPKMEDFDDTETYIQKFTEWNNTQLAAKAAPNDPPTEEEGGQTVSPDMQHMIDTMNDATEEGKAKYKDFEEVVFNDDVQFTPEVAHAMFASEQAADIAYYIGKHPEVAKALNGMDETAAAIEIGKIEATLSSEVVPDATFEFDDNQAPAEPDSVTTEPSSPPAAPPKKVTSAPDPITTLSGSDSPGGKPADLYDPKIDQANYEAQRNKEMAAARARGHL